MFFRWSFFSMRRGLEHDGARLQLAETVGPHPGKRGLLALDNPSGLIAASAASVGTDASLF
jgi:hypothetical protein